MVGKEGVERRREGCVERRGLEVEDDAESGTEEGKFMARCSRSGFAEELYVCQRQFGASGSPDSLAVNADRHRSSQLQTLQQRVELRRS